MRKILFVFGVGIMMTACSSGLQASVVFDEAWDDIVSEFNFGKRSSFDQDEMLDSFGRWADVYEQKRSKLVRRDEKGRLLGTTVILGENISNSIEQMQESIEKLHKIEELYEVQKKLLRQVCAAQKTRVSCGL